MRNAILILAAAIAVAGCKGGRFFGHRQAVGPPSGVDTETTETTTAPTTQPTGGPVMVYVNSRPIYMEQLHGTLVTTFGMRAAQWLIADELVAEAAAERNLTASDEEVRIENERTLNHLFPSASADQRERLLEQLLIRRQLPHRQWEMTMRRNVLLSKLIAPSIEISDEELEDEFAEQYGRKVVVRHIQTTSLGEAQEVLERLRAGADFNGLARRVSKNRSAADGGLLPPIGPRTKGLAPAMREAALAMKKLGEVSEPIQVMTAFHILYLERIIEPEGVSFEDVKDSLATAVKAKNLRVHGQRLMREMIRNAKIEYVNPILKRQAIEAGKEE